MKYSKEQLIEMVKPYFDNEKVELLYVTEDNQVFYPNKKVDAFSHSRVYKLRAPYEISRDDFKVKKEKKEEAKPKVEKVAVKEDDSEKEALIEMAEELGLKVDKRMGIAKLEELIKDNENARK